MLDGFVLNVLYGVYVIRWNIKYTLIVLEISKGAIVDVMLREEEKTNETITLGHNFQEKRGAISFNIENDGKQYWLLW